MLKEIVGRNIRFLRMAHDLSQKELSEKIEISERQLVRIENGQIFPNMTKLDGLSELFGVSVESLTQPYNKVLLFRELFLNPSLGSLSNTKNKKYLLENYLNQPELILDNHDRLLLDLFDFNLSIILDKSITQQSFTEQYEDEFNALFTKTYFREVDYYLIMTFLSQSIIFDNLNFAILEKLAKLVIDTRTRTIGERSDCFYLGVLIKLAFSLLLLKNGFQSDELIEKLLEIQNKTLENIMNYFHKGGYQLVQLVYDYMLTNNHKQFTHQMDTLISGSNLISSSFPEILEKIKKGTIENTLDSEEVVKYFLV